MLEWRKHNASPNEIPHTPLSFTAHGYNTATMITSETPTTELQTSTKSPQRPIKALFLDIDGTLVTHDDRISHTVKRSLQLAIDKGVLVTLCTGRTRHRLIPIAEQMPGKPGYAITSNGGVVIDLNTGETIYRHLMPVPIALHVIKAIVDSGSEPYVFEDSDLPGIEGSRVLFHPNLPVGHWAEVPRYRPFAEMMKELPFEPVSVSCFGHPNKMRPLAAQLLEEMKGSVSIIQSGSNETWGVEIYVANINKQLGLETIAARLQVDQNEIMAIGDHINDLEMIQWAGIGVAMGNALPEIRAAANWTTSSVLQDGVARAIENFIL